MVSEVNNGYQGHILKIMIIIYNNGYQGNILKIVIIIYFEMNVLFTKICVLYIYIYISKHGNAVYIKNNNVYSYQGFVRFTFYWSFCFEKWFL